MRTEDKELLLKDLSARLPYGVIIEGLDHPEIMTIKHLAIISAMSTEPYKPYLRPISSMTEEERKEYEGFIIHRKHVNAQGQEWDIDCFSFDGASRLIDWLNANHFDYRGLIPRGLAIEVTKENNPYGN